MSGKSSLFYSELLRIWYPSCWEIIITLTRTLKDIPSLQVFVTIFNKSWRKEIELFSFLLLYIEIKRKNIFKETYVNISVRNTGLLTSSSENDTALALWPTWQLTKWKEPPAASIISKASFIRNWSNKWPLRDTCQLYPAISVRRLTSN